MDGQYWLSLAINIGVMGIIAFFLRNFFIDIKDVMNKTHELITAGAVQAEINTTRTKQIEEIHTVLNIHTNDIKATKDEVININRKVDKIILAHAYQHEEDIKL